MNNKNKQYKIEKGVLLFTQPRSSYFYGKLRVNGKYITKSFAPVEDYDAALEMLYKWREEIFGENKNKFNIGSSSNTTNFRDEYLSNDDYNEKIILGDASKQSILSILNSKEYNDLREAHNKNNYKNYSFCDNCDQLLCNKNKTAIVYSNNPAHKGMDKKDIVKRTNTNPNQPLIQ